MTPTSRDVLSTANAMDLLAMIDEQENGLKLMRRLAEELAKKQILEAAAKREEQGVPRPGRGA